MDDGLHGVYPQRARILEREFCVPGLIPVWGVGEGQDATDAYFELTGTVSMETDPIFHSYLRRLLFRFLLISHATLWWMASGKVV